MGVKIGDDAENSGKNNHLLAIMRVRLVQKIGLLVFKNRTRIKKETAIKCVQKVCAITGECV